MTLELIPEPDTPKLDKLLVELKELEHQLVTDEMIDEALAAYRLAGYHGENNSTAMFDALRAVAPLMLRRVAALRASLEGERS